MIRISKSLTLLTKWPTHNRRKLTCIRWRSITEALSLLMGLGVLFTTTRRIHCSHLQKTMEEKSYEMAVLLCIQHPMTATHNRLAHVHDPLFVRDQTKELPRCSSFKKAEGQASGQQFGSNLGQRSQKGFNGVVHLLVDSSRQSGGRLGDAGVRERKALAGHVARCHGARRAEAGCCTITEKKAG